MKVILSDVRDHLAEMTPIQSLRWTDRIM